MDNKKSRICLITSAVLVLGTVICALSFRIGPTLLSNSEGEVVYTDISAHVIVITALFALATVFLFLYLKFKNDALSSKENLIIALLFLIAGFLFSIASGCLVQSARWSSYYTRMLTEPAWYAGSITSKKFFGQLPLYAKRFRTYGIVFVFLSIIMCVVTACIYSKYSKNMEKKKN